jgi:GntR family transcriptional regulator
MSTPAAPSFQPLYLQIKALLEKSLEVREWGPGAAIPSEIELAGRFGVSQGTVRKAIDALAADNLVVRRQGKGTFVATHTEEQASASASCAFATTTATTSIQRVACSTSSGQGGRRRSAPARAAPGDAVLSCAACWSGRAGGAGRDHTAGGTVPWSDPGAVRRLSRLDVWIVRDAVWRAHAEREHVSAIARTRQRVLGVAVGVPLLAVDRVTLTYGDRPVEVRRGLCNTSSITISTSFADVDMTSAIVAWYGVNSGVTCTGEAIIRCCAQNPAENIKKVTAARRLRLPTVRSVRV